MFMLDQNTDRMWYVIGAILIGAVVIYAGIQLYDSSFRGVGENFDELIVQADNPTIEERLEDVDLFIWNEKDWIIQNQDAELGVIYMNNTNGTQNVNPYFASLAVQGLMAGDVRVVDMDAAKAYLDWHSDLFIETNGHLSDYKVVDGLVSVSSDPDSIDAYIGAYITALIRYLENGGSMPSDKLDQVINIALDQWQSLERFGMTVVSHDYNVVYLMDNIEVLRAYYDLLDYVSNTEIRNDLTSRIVRMRDGMNNRLWDDVANRYIVGVSGGSGNPIRMVSESNLYPDAISQIYNIAYDLDLKGINHSQEQYAKFNEYVNWTDVTRNDPDGFYWSELFLIATKMKDVPRSERYLRSYIRHSSESRSYPLHTAASGWAVKGAVELKAIYETELVGNSGE